jgi:IS5 family transposase
MQLRCVYGDRGFGTSTADAALARRGVPDAVIPRQQRAAPVERTRAWRRRYRFRNGLEGRISQLKRKGLARTRLPGLAGAQTWVGGVALTHNQQRIALLA